MAKGSRLILACAPKEIHNHNDNKISLTSGTGGLVLSSSADVRVHHILTLEKTIGEPNVGPLTGSLMNSGSIDSDSKLWFFNGTEWKERAVV